MAQSFTGQTASSWLTCLGFSPEQFEFLWVPGTRSLWLLEALFHSTEQKLSDQTKEVTFQQGLAFAPPMRAKPRTKQRTSNPLFITSVSIVLPSGLVTMISSWFFKHRVIPPHGVVR